MHDTIDLKNPHRPIRVGVILTASVTEILDVAPIDIFNGISKDFLTSIPGHLLTDKVRKQALDVEFHWINESGQEAKLTAGGLIKPTHTFDDCPTLDIALMGAHEPSYTCSDAEITFVKKCYADCNAFLFICGGFMVALQAGMLEGKTATAPRPMIGCLRQAHPGVKWVEQRWAHDGKVWTSGALLNGTHMTKTFATETWGGEEDDFVGMGVRLGGYPDRDINYADVPWAL